MHNLNFASIIILLSNSRQIITMQTAQIISCSKVITLHLLQSRQPTNLYNPHKGIVNGVHINHTNKVIASCGQDGRIVLVNASKTDNQVFQTSFHGDSPNQKPVSVNCVMFSNHSHFIAAGSSDCLVKIWDMKNHKQVYSTIKSHVGQVTSLSWIKNSGIEKGPEILASSSTIGDIFLHSIKTSNIIETLNAKNQQSINQIKVSEADGYCRLAACTASGSVMVWNIRNLEKNTNPHCYFNNGKKSSITSVSFSSFNPILLATSSLDQTLTFYDTNEKKSVKVIPCQQPLTTVNFHSDGHTLIAGGNYGGLFVYDLRKPSKPRQKLTGHDSAIKCSVLIKQPDNLSSTNMDASRTSKSSSVNSFNSKGANSKQGKQIKEKQSMKQVKLNNFVETGSKNQINFLRADSTNKPKNQVIESKKQNQKMPVSSQQVKLSVTSQQIIKNSEIKTGAKTAVISTPANGYNYYNKPTESSSGSFNQIGTNPASSRNIQNSGTKAGETSSWNIIPQMNSLSKQSITGSRQQQEASVSQLKQFIQEKFQLIHMELINQFYLQQKEFKQIVTSLLVQDKKKSQRIKQLQQAVKQLKQNSY